MSRKALILAIICGTLGLIFFVGGLSTIPVFKNLIHNEIKDNIPIENGSVTYKDFLTPPSPIYFQIWVFDVANHIEVLQNGDKPVLVQKGPYTYREKRLKVNVTFNKNDTVTYQEKRWYIFDEELSGDGLTEDDNFTTLNIPFATIDNLIKYQFNWIQELVELLLATAEEKFFITISVKELMWGYEDPLLKMAAKILKEFNYTLDDRFGLFKGNNDSDDGLYTIYTGKIDTSKHGVIDRWNGLRNLPYWTSKAADMINGSDGTMYPPFLDTSKPIYVFSSDVCRSLYCEYEKSYYLKEIEVYRFVAPPALFENSTVNPANHGFCTEAEGCLPSGVVDVSACRESAPIVLSQPHFLAADPSIQNSVIGLHPNTEEHQTVLDVEPMTGTTMNAAKKLQINIHIMNVSHIVQTTNIRSMFLPILWLNESAVIDNKSAAKFRTKVQQPMKLTSAIQVALITIGAFILCCVLVFVVRRKFCKPVHRVKDTEPIMENNISCQNED